MSSGTGTHLSAAWRRLYWVLYPVMALLVLSPLLTSAPALAGDAYWSAETIPGTTGNVLGPAGIDVRDIAVAADGTTIYAVPGDSIAEQIVYRSTDTGASWAELDVSIAADLVAVAPDDAGTVAIADSATAQVYVTTNSGLNWYDLGVPGEGGSAAAAVDDIAISKAVNGVNYIAVAGREAAHTANTWYYKLGAVGASWRGTAALGGFSAASQAAAVAFSPDFPSDEAMTVITENDGDSVTLQIFSFDTGSWNSSAGFNPYPLAIISGGGITGLDSASLSLAPDYASNSEELRTAFIGLAVSGGAADVASSGIYRVENDQVTALKTGVGIHSVAFDGASLVAGSYQSTTVYRSQNPLASSPTVSLPAALKEPGGTGRVVVAWAGDNVAAGTSGNESAFAMSRDGGAAFNDISLIDTDHNTRQGRGRSR